MENKEAIIMGGPLTDLRKHLEAIRGEQMSDKPVSIKVNVDLKDLQEALKQIPAISEEIKKKALDEFERLKKEAIQNIVDDTIKKIADALSKEEAVLYVPDGGVMLLDTAKAVQFALSISK